MGSMTHNPGDFGSPSGDTTQTPGMEDSLIFLRGLKVIRGAGTSEPFVLEVPELRIPRGQVTSILGGSGCGKTTLLMVLGLMRGADEDPAFTIECEKMVFRLPTSQGSIEERVVYQRLKENGEQQSLTTDEREELRRDLIGFCLQGGELIPSLSLIDNVAIPRKISGLDRSIPLARERLNQLGLDKGDQEDKSDQPDKSLIGSLPRELSGGQNQRGIIARALIHEPPLIVLDEPTSQLDRETASESIRILRDQARRLGQTIIMVTHDVDLAGEVSDYIVKMDVKGKALGVADVARRNPKCSPLTEYDLTPGALEASTSRRSKKPASWLDFVRLGFMDALGPIYGMLSDFLGRRPKSIKDMTRSRSYAFLGRVIRNSLVIVSIGILIMLLRGMRSGLIEDFRENLTRSPTARELTITPLVQTGALSRSDLDRMSQEYPEIEIIIPSATHVAFLSENADREESVTLVGTTANDPLLWVVNPDQDFTGFNQNAVVLPVDLAEELGATIGSQVTIWLSRMVDREGLEKEYLPAKLTVSNIIRGGEGRVARVHIDFAEDITDFKAGRPVKHRAWPGRPQMVSPRYASFLLVGKRGLSGRERTTINSRGLRETMIPPDTLSDLLSEIIISKTAIESKGVPPLTAYRLLSGRQEGALRWLDGSLLKLERLLTDSDGVLLSRDDPMPASLDGQEVQLVGFSGSARWLKKYLLHPKGIFPRAESSWQLTFGDLQDSTRTSQLEVETNGGLLSFNIEVHKGPENVPLAVDTALGKVSPPPVGKPVMPTLISISPDSAARGITDTILRSTSQDSIDSLSTTPSHVAGIVDTTVTAQSKSTTPTVIVPAAFLAHLWMCGEGLAEPDPDMQIFRDASEEHVYYRARVFVNDVYQVVHMHELLSGRFAVRSNQARVKEIQMYRSVLDYLVNVLSVISIIVAFSIVWMVFRDVSDRKMRMIGTLRIMGLPKRGVLTLLLTHGVLVAVVASLLLIALGSLSSLLLNLLLEDRACVLGIVDYILVIATLVIVCLFGTWFPARAVSKVDPVVALEQAMQRG